MILIIDDHPETCRTLSRLLKLARYSARFVHNGHDALSIMAASPPLCVILDQMMPDISGLDVLRAMRGNSALAAIPVIFFTALDSDQVRQQALEAGANEWALKGTPWEQMLQLVGKYVPAPAE